MSTWHATVHLHGALHEDDADTLLGALAEHEASPALAVSADRTTVSIALHTVVPTQVIARFSALAYIAGVLHGLGIDAPVEDGEVELWEEFEAREAAADQ